jgi:plastocyanin
MGSPVHNRLMKTAPRLGPYRLEMRRAALLTALGLALAGCGGGEDDEDGGAAAGAPIRTITIEETEYALEPSSVQVERPGTYTLRVVNKGSVGHALEIEGEGIEEATEVLDAGEEATLAVDLKEGSYELYCPVGDHEDRGMTGRVGVAEVPPATTDESDSGSDY